MYGSFQCRTIVWAEYQHPPPFVSVRPLELENGDNGDRRKGSFLGEQRPCGRKECIVEGSHSRRGAAWHIGVATGIREMPAYFVSIITADEDLQRGVFPPSSSKKLEGGKARDYA